jgi:hypothetical protein
MQGVATSEPPLDPRWLDLLADSCQGAGHGGPRLLDLYLERRFELRVLALHGSLRVEECHLEGVAARWLFPGRTLVHGVTGISPAAIATLLSRFDDGFTLPTARFVPAAELDAPRSFREWSRELVERLAPRTASARFLARNAVVVRAGSWSLIGAPPLVRISLGSGPESALLAVWRHDRLKEWLAELASPAAKRPWCPTSGSRLPVLFSEGTGGALVHELLGHPLEADLAANGVSPLAGLDGALMTAPTLNLTDDPTRFDLPGAFSCDDEGVPAEPLTLVADGTLRGWLCDRAAAERRATVPGRGRRATFKHPPVARLSNLVISPGQTPPDDLRSDLGKGLEVTRVSGATVDPVSGRTVIQVERGWEVAHGRRRRPLGRCALTGGIAHILARVDPHLGTDSEPDWRLGWCVKGGLPLPTGSSSPTLLVREIEVL